MCVNCKLKSSKSKAEDNLINLSKLKEVQAFTFHTLKPPKKIQFFFLCFSTSHLLLIFTVFVYYHGEYLFTNESSGDSVVLKLIPRFT